MTPNWFTITMGTGVILQLLLDIGGHVPLLHVLAFSIFVLNVGIDLLLFTLILGRFVIGFQQAFELLKNPQQSLFSVLFRWGYRL